MRGKVKDRKYSGRRVLCDLTDQQWLDLWRRLTLFASKRYYGVDAQDLISEAVTSVMEGRRVWDQDKSPFHNLCLIVRSVASNQLAKAKPFVSLPTDDELFTDRSFATVSPLPIQVEVFEQREADERFGARLRQELRDDNMLDRIINYLMEDPRWKPKKIAEDLEEETKNVNNARKRLMRVLRGLGKS